MKTKWNGILQILEVKQLDKDGKVLWTKENIYNTLHIEGEDLFLKILFTQEEAVPESYLVGLDNRTTIQLDDTLSDLTDEPTTGGYERQILTPSSFEIDMNNSNKRAKSAIITFTAISGDWGPIKNLFLCTEDVLISSVSIGSGITVPAGEAISLRAIVKLTN